MDLFSRPTRPESVPRIYCALSASSVWFPHSRGRDGDVKKIRIVLANRPRMARQVVGEMIEGQHDMEVVREASSRFDLLLAVKETNAHAMTMSARDSEDPGLCSHLLSEYPGLTVVTLGVEGRRAFVEQLCPSRREIANPSSANVLAALREAIREPCGWLQQREDRPSGSPGGTTESAR